MKNKILSALLITMGVFLCQRGLAADTNNAAIELQQLVAKVRADVQSGKRTEADLAGDLRRFDTLLAEHKGQKTEAVAQILFMKATLYLQILNDQDKATKLFKQVEADFPGTQAAQNAGRFLTMIAQQAEAKKIQSALVVGARFPSFSEKDLTGQPLSPGNYKGKLLLIDFWATWCPPCRGEVPNVVATYQKYHHKGFEIIGVSLDKDKKTLLNFIKNNKMTWPEFFDGQGWDNKLAVKYGIRSIPMNYLLDRHGKIIGEDLRGDELSQAVAKALAQ